MGVLATCLMIWKSERHSIYLSPSYKKCSIFCHQISLVCRHELPFYKPSHTKFIFKRRYIPHIFFLQCNENIKSLNIKRRQGRGSVKSITNVGIQFHTKTVNFWKYNYFYSFLFPGFLFRIVCKERIVVKVVQRKLNSQNKRNLIQEAESFCSTAKT